MAGSKVVQTVKMVIMGPPGSGKGTLAERIVNHFYVRHISCGDYIRSNIRAQTFHGREAHQYIKRGELVPDDIVAQIIVGELDRHAHESWLLDGFPRTVKQAELLMSRDPVDHVIELKVPFEVIIDRVKHRWIHEASGRLYNLQFSPPNVPFKDDLTGEPLSQREDDQAETVLTRLRNYDRWEMPVANYFRERKLLKTFAGSTTNEIWPSVYNFLLHTNRLKLKPKGH